MLPLTYVKDLLMGWWRSLFSVSCAWTNIENWQRVENYLKRKENFTRKLHDSNEVTDRLTTFSSFSLLLCVSWCQLSLPFSPPFVNSLHYRHHQLKYGILCNVMEVNVDEKTLISLVNYKHKSNISYMGALLLSTYWRSQPPMLIHHHVVFDNTRWFVYSMSHLPISCFCFQ